METKGLNWACECDKCGHKWRTLTADHTVACGKCRSVKWNHKSVNDHTCFQCGETWTDAIVNPATCIGCDSPDYDQQKPSKPVQIATSIDDKQSTINALKSLMSGKPAPDFFSPDYVIESVKQDWQFTKGQPEYNENGNVYRQQRLAPEFKQSRTVQVDTSDHSVML